MKKFRPTKKETSTSLTPLALMPTRDLIREVLSRFDSCVMLGEKSLGGGQYERSEHFVGSAASIVGILKMAMNQVENHAQYEGVTFYSLGDSDEDSEFTDSAYLGGDDDDFGEYGVPSD